MSPGCRRLSRALLLLALLVTGLVIVPAPAAAETSYHKLKKKLRKAEHEIGPVVLEVGEVVADGVCEIVVDVCLGCDDEDAVTAPARRPGRAGTEKTQHAAIAKTSEKPHPAKASDHTEAPPPPRPHHIP
jgi:hypothetical protein